ncbi:hypothetical protein DFH11DRAFT_1831079 [Phellopilus nigrolimitatus]|nr:hypothetical protein DFH11DRAFT_1831079 [Phellopilus nigrolimitatus]
MALSRIRSATRSSTKPLRSSHWRPASQVTFGLAESTQSRARSDSPTLFSPDESPDPLPGLSYGLVRNMRRSPSPPTLPARSSMSPGRDLLQLLYPNRFSADADVQSLQHPAESVDTAASSACTPEDFDFHDLPSLDDSRPRIWGWRPEQEAGNGTGQTQRNATARSASRPPSLPPLRFDHLPLIAPEREMESAESRLFGSEDSTAHVAPWRRGAARQDTPTYESAWTRRSTQRNEIVLQRAMLLQSVQARQTQAHDAEREPAAAATGRSHGFHHAMNVLGSDGLSSARRQQFTSAYDRECEHPQPPRIDTHVRWGDIADEDHGSTGKLIYTRNTDTLSTNLQAAAGVEMLEGQHIHFPVLELSSTELPSRRIRRHFPLSTYTRSTTGQ